MAQVTLAVTGGGGWTPIGQTFPANQNDGIDDTYQSWPGDTAGSNANYYDYAQVPDGAIISLVEVFGNWGAGSASATVTAYFTTPSGQINLGTINDVTSYYFSSASRPGGGSWTKTDIQNLHFDVVSNQTGNGNAMKLRSSALRVTYVLSGETFVSIF